MKAVDWHVEALRMDADGLSSGRIAETLGKNRETVKKYLARAKKDPSKALQTVASAPVPPPPPPLQLDEEDNRTLVELYLSVERQRARVLKKTLTAIERVFDMTSATMNEFDLKKGEFALRAAAALKSTGTLPDLDKMKDAGKPGEIKDIRVEVVRVTRNDASTSP